ncbi:MAG: 2-hydroxyacid dehydrogenase [Defluviicoccus sp.]
MKVLVVSARSYDRDSLTAANVDHHDLQFSESKLTAVTASMVIGFPAVCGFVNDRFDADVLATLAQNGTRLVTLRSTGFNNVDLKAAEAHGITVMRVSNYSPYSVAEFVVCLILALNRKVHKAYLRAREEYFLLDGLLGFDLHGKAVGIVGTGKIGRVLAGILNGFGCRLLGYDIVEDPACQALGMKYLPLDDVLAQADIVSLHAPLTRETYHLMNERTIGLTKKGAMLINTGRGALIDTKALIKALKSGHLGSAGLDVYEEEEGIFFHDLSGQVISDDVFARLLTFPNVIVTGHQGFFTREALHDIATATMQNLRDFAAGRSNANALTAGPLVTAPA